MSKALRPDITGLRAIAVIAVAAYHIVHILNPHSSWFAGGFVGVDVFFVISGYLMTMLILRDVTLGRFSLYEFYKRRAQRICPALLVVVSLVAILGLLVIGTEDLIRLAYAGGWALLMGSNFYFAFYTDYFANAALDQPLLHTWSLGLEWQFYLIHPLILLALRRFCVPSLLARSFCVLTFLWFGLALYGATLFPKYAYYLLPMRGFELMVGGLAYFYPLRNFKTWLLEHWPRVSVGQTIDSQASVWRTTNNQTTLGLATDSQARVGQSELTMAQSQAKASSLVSAQAQAKAGQALGSEQESLFVSGKSVLPERILAYETDQGKLEHKTKLARKAKRAKDNLARETEQPELVGRDLAKRDLAERDSFEFESAATSNLAANLAEHAVKCDSTGLEKKQAEAQQVVSKDDELPRYRELTHYRGEILYRLVAQAQPWQGELLGLVLITYSVFTVDAQLGWPNLKVLWPLVGSYLCIAANHQKTCLRFKVFQKLGLWSYAIYLVHWPILVLFTKLGIAWNWHLDALSLGTMAPSGLDHQSLSALGSGLVGASPSPSPEPGPGSSPGASSSSGLDSDLSAGIGAGADAGYGAGSDLGYGIGSGVIGLMWLMVLTVLIIVAGALLHTLVEKRRNYGYPTLLVYVVGVFCCFYVALTGVGQRLAFPISKYAQYGGHGIPFDGQIHEIGDTQRAPDFILIGDSFARHYTLDLQDRNLHVITVLTDGCYSFAQHINLRPEGKVADTCKIRYEQALTALAQYPDIPVVFAQDWPRYASSLVERNVTHDVHALVANNQSEKQGIERLNAQADSLLAENQLLKLSSQQYASAVAVDLAALAQAVGQRQIYVLGTPLQPVYDIGSTCMYLQALDNPLSRWLRQNVTCVSHHTLRDIAFNDWLEREIKKYPNFTYLNPNEALCVGTDCELLVDGVLPVYQDGLHYSWAGSVKVVSYLLFRMGLPQGRMRLRFEDVRSLERPAPHITLGSAPKTTSDWQQYSQGTPASNSNHTQEAESLSKTGPTYVPVSVSAPASDPAPRPTQTAVSALDDAPSLQHSVKPDSNSTSGGNSNMSATEENADSNTDFDESAPDHDASDKYQPIPDSAISPTHTPFLGE